MTRQIAFEPLPASVLFAPLLFVGWVHMCSASRVCVAVERAPESKAAKNRKKNGCSGESGEGARSEKDDGNRTVSEQKADPYDWLP